MLSIVDYKELADKLKISPKTIQKIWRNLPCVFVGLGRDLRAARFDVNEVWEHLRHERDSLHLVERHRTVSGEVPVSRNVGPKKRVQESASGPKMGGGRTPEAGEPRSSGNPKDIIRRPY